MSRADLLVVLSDAASSGRLDHAAEIADEIKALGEVKLGSDTPWDRGEWHGDWVSIDDCDATGFDNDAGNILLVIAYGATEPGWDGESAGIVLLKDGRFVSWESNWGPTGSGFSCDAYGGTADIAFSSSLSAATAYISEQRRELLRYEP